MYSEARPTLIVIGGPTGVGKTDVAIDLAMQSGGEIISADSMQVYRRFQIGTAKPTAEQCRGVPYHGIDLIEPTETFHLGAFIEMADRLIAEITARGRQPLVVGGTGLYIKGLLEGVFEAPPVDVALRKRLLERAKTEGAPALHAELARVDSAAAARISPTDSIRIVRALEIWTQTGRPISELWAKQRPAASGGACGAVGSDRSSGFASPSSAAESRYPYHLFVLHCERAFLYEQINRRVEAMFRAGLADEVRHLLAAGLSPESHAFKALGYRHVLAWIEGRISKPDAIAAMQKHTRHYAKRQLTWFRAMTGAQWIDVGTRPAADVAAEISARVNSQPPRKHTWFCRGKSAGSSGEDGLLP